MPAAAVKAEFLKAYPAESEDPKLKARAKAKAFERAMLNGKLLQVNLVCARDLEAYDSEIFYWRLDVK